MKSNNLISSIFKNATILLSGNIVASVFTLFSLSIFTYSQGVEKFGYFVLFLTFSELISKLFALQTWQTFIKFASDFLEDSRENLQIVFKYLFILETISLLFASFFSFLISDWLIKIFEIPSDYHAIVVFLPLIILFQIADISIGVFRVFDHFKSQAKLEASIALFRALAFLFVAFTAPAFLHFIYALLLVQFFAMLSKLYLMKIILLQNNIHLVEIIKQKINFELIRSHKIVSFTLYNNFDISIRIFSRQADYLLLAKLFGAEIVGLYKIAKELANIAAKLSDPVYQAIYPEFAKIISKNSQELRTAAIKISSFATLVAVVIYVLFAIFGEFAIKIAFGEEFVGAYAITLYYFVAIIISIAALPLVPILLAKGMAKDAFKNQLLATLIYAIVLVPLVYSHSAIGASIAYIIFYTVWVVLTLNTLKQGSK